MLLRLSAPPRFRGPRGLRRSPGRLDARYTVEDPLMPLMKSGRAFTIEGLFYNVMQAIRWDLGPTPK
jgi:hypothetical protein